jgi:hypothetical protein
MRNSEETIMKTSLFALAFFTLTLPAFGQEVDPLIGTWKLNLEKSTANFPLPKSISFTVVPDGKNMLSTVEAVNTEGQLTKFTIPHIYDGVPHPITGAPGYDAVLTTRIGNTFNQTCFNNSKPVEILQGVIADKTFTATTEGVTPRGQSYHYTYVYDRQ